MSPLLQRMRDVAVRRHLSPRTVECYESWVRQFLRFCRDEGRWRHPRERRDGDVAAFLTHLARDRRAASATQNQATCAIVFLYRQVLAEELGADHLGPIAAERSSRPVGYDVCQVQTLLGHASLKTTMVYTHVMHRPAVAVTSPLDRLAAVG